MSGRKSKKVNMWKGAMVAAATLILMTLMEAMLVWKGIVGIKAISVCSPVASLIAGIAAAVCSREGEGRVSVRLITAIVPALLLLVAGIAVSAGSGIRAEQILCVVLIALPGLLSMLIGDSGGKSAWKRRKKRRGLQG